jgi:hypothetical protein
MLRNFVGNKAKLSHRLSIKIKEVFVANFGVGETSAVLAEPTFFSAILFYLP